MMIHSPEFRVADLLAQAGDEGFQAAGSDVREIDGPHEDEWSLYTTITLGDGQMLETILHHGTGTPLNGDCNCSQGVNGSSAPIWCGSALSTSASTLHRPAHSRPRPHPLVTCAVGWPP